MKIQAKRVPLTIKEFCKIAQIPINNSDFAESLRTAFAEEHRYDPKRIYPEDNIDYFWMMYMTYDEMAEFLMWNGFLKEHDKYQYVHLLHKIDSFSDLIKTALKINKEIEQAHRP